MLEKNDRLLRIRKTVEEWELRKKEAQNNKISISFNGWSFAICGIVKEDITYKFSFLENTCIEFRPIKQSPLIEELAEVAKNYNTVLRAFSYLSIMGYELFIENKDNIDNKTISYIAYCTIAALRIKSGLTFVVPISIESSWSIVPSLGKKSTSVNLIEDYPKAMQISDNRSIQVDDLEWVNKYANNIIDLSLKYPAFSIAVEALSSFHQVGSLRMCIVTLWAGIEALLGINAELRYRIAITIACYLESDKEKRVQLYSEIKQMYDFRSKAVHGSSISDKKIGKHITFASTLLRNLLTKISETNHLPCAKEYEMFVFD